MGSTFSSSPAREQNGLHGYGAITSRRQTSQAKAVARQDRTGREGEVDDDQFEQLQQRGIELMKQGYV
jgi:hypothetical protein